MDIEGLFINKVIFTEFEALSTTIENSYYQNGNVLDNHVIRKDMIYIQEIFSI